MPKKHKVSRYERMKELGHPLAQLPKVGPGEYLLHYLIEVGPTGPTGEPLSFTEIHHWCDLTGITLTPFEAQTLRQLSVAYAAQYQKSTDINCHPPWYTTDKTQDERRAAVADGLRALAKRKRSKGHGN